MTCSGVVAGRFTPEYVGERTRSRRPPLRRRTGAHRLPGRCRQSPAARPPPTSNCTSNRDRSWRRESLPVGVVGGIVGITWNEVTIAGQADHAGPSPMHLRRDALAAAAEIILGVEQIAKRRDETAVAHRRPDRRPTERDQHDSWARSPSAPISATPIPAVLERQVDSLQELVADVAARRAVEADDRALLDQRADAFDPRCTAAIRPAAAAARHLDRRALVGRRARRQVPGRCLPDRHDLRPQPGRTQPLRSRIQRPGGYRGRRQPAPQRRHHARRVGK